MSMHKKPLTVWEREGLNSHHLPVDTPSQLSDVFRQGMAWGQKQSQAEYDALVITANTQSDKLSKIRIYCQGNNIGNWGDSSTDALINHCNALAAQIAAIQHAWEKTNPSPFKITDQRYEPEDTSYLETPAVEPVSVDEIVQAKKEFAAMPTLLQGLMQESFDRLIADMEEKRKAETEKKRVVDAVVSAWSDIPDMTDFKECFSKLYDAGYLRIPEVKE